MRKDFLLMALGNKNHIHLSKQKIMNYIFRSRPQFSTVTASIEFHKDLPKNLEFLAFGISNDILEIDGNRDFSVKSMEAM